MYMQSNVGIVIDKGVVNQVSFLSKAIFVKEVRLFEVISCIIIWANYYNS